MKKLILFIMLLIGVTVSQAENLTVIMYAVMCNGSSWLRLITSTGLTDWVATMY